jgi:hypothetical protein
VTIKELMEEQRRQIRSSNPAERFAAALLIPAEISKRLRLLTDSQVGRLMDREVCPNLNFVAPELTVCIEAAERLQRPRTDRRRAARSRASSRQSQGEHLLHAEAALYRAGIPYLLLPFQRDKFASNVFVVPSLPDAHRALCGAGFRASNNFPSLLIDPETNRPIRLIENRT